MRPNSTLSEAKRLFDLGLAVHWLMPRSKRPLGSWNSQTRVSWNALSSSFQPDLNLGVKLGPPSRLPSGYLACIDCDVKSVEEEHRVEMQLRLEELYPGLYERAPMVVSGRGHGSCHLYGVTKEPLGYLTLAQSRFETRVSMPSVKASRREQEILTEEDLAAGIRLRPAWEISLMSHGRQMVLPPSIHPDSGKRYQWTRKLNDTYDLPAIDPRDGVGGLERVDAAGGIDFRAFLFTPHPVDLIMDERISQHAFDLITRAEVDDQSAALFKACILLNQAGFTQDEILSILTDTENALGHCAYRHIQKPVDLKYRGKAAYWVWKYNLIPAIAKTSAEANFERVVEESPVAPVLSDAEAMAQAAELVGGESTGDWELQLERGGPNGEGRPKATLANIKLIFTHAVGPHLFRKNEFTHREVYGMDTPWGGETGREINDTDLVLMKYWLATRFRMEPPVNLINEAVTKLTHENRFHPVRDYLARLEWDGIPRIDTWLKKYMNAKASEPYLSAISRKTLCAMIARVMNPGHQFDCVLILEGGQGVGKSTSIRKLASPEWFSDTHIEIKDKDAVLSMQGVWAIEFGELSSLKKSDVDQLKEFISRREDRIRVPYGHRTEIFPRQCIFIGTTNNSEYFQDLTGNRRFWPVEVGECDFNGIERDRDQLFAEARWYYDLGENLYLDDKEAAAGGRVEQEQRLIVDAWTEQLETFLDSLADQSPSERPFDPGCFSMLELFDVRGPFEGVRMTPSEQKRAGAALRKIGFRVLVKRENGKLTRRWGRVTR